MEGFSTWGRFLCKDYSTLGWGEYCILIHYFINPLWNLLFAASNFDFVMFIHNIHYVLFIYCVKEFQSINCDSEALPPPCFKWTRTFFSFVLSPSVWLSLQLHSNSDKGDGSVRYILDGEGAGTIFIIDEVTGDIHATKSLDREKKSHYVLHAQALDRYTEEALEPKSEFIIKVQDINDNAPKFPDAPFVATVPEMSEVGESSFKA